MLRETRAEAAWRPEAARAYPSVLLFLGLVVAFSAPFDLLLIHGAQMDALHGFVIHGQMWAPTLAALCACAVTHRPLALLGLNLPSFRWLALGYLAPVAYALAAFIAIWTLGLAPLAMEAFSAAAARGLRLTEPVAASIAVGLTLSYGVMQSALSAAGEEIGWRGLLVPALVERIGVRATVLISGLIWASWHMPLVLFSSYNGAAPRAFAVACFTVMIVSSGAIAVWLRLKSGSVWPAVVLHACHNALIQWVLDPMTVETGRGAWFAGEFGCALAATTTLVAGCLPWRSVLRSRKTPPDRSGGARRLS